jgi:hypothetical protein
VRSQLHKDERRAAADMRKVSSSGAVSDSDVFLCHSSVSRGHSAAAPVVTAVLYKHSSQLAAAVCGRVARGGGVMAAR